MGLYKIEITEKYIPKNNLKEINQINKLKKFQIKMSILIKILIQTQITQHKSSKKNQNLRK